MNNPDEDVITNCFAEMDFSLLLSKNVKSIAQIFSFFFSHKRGSCLHADVADACRR
jgi:hypothetical protein